MRSTGKRFFFLKKQNTVENTREIICFSQMVLDADLSGKGAATKSTPAVAAGRADWGGGDGCGGKANGSFVAKEAL